MSMLIEKELRELKNSVSKLTETIESKSIERKYLKTSEACYYLSCSKNTLLKICGTYGFRPKKILGENYYAIDDLNRVFLDEAV